MRTFVFAGLAGCGTRWIVLVEEFLESGQCLRLEFDEVVEFSVVLRTYGIDEFCSGLENKVGRVSSERSDSIDVVSDAVACRLRGEFARGSFREFLHDERAKFVKCLITLGFGFPFSDGGVKGACTFYSGLEKCEASLWIGGNADLSKLLFELVVAFELGGWVLGWIPSVVHGTDEFLDVDVIQGGAVGAKVGEEFDGCSMSESQTFAAKARELFGIDGLNDLRACGLEASLVGFILNDELFVFCELA